MQQTNPFGKRNGKELEKPTYLFTENYDIIDDPKFCQQSTGYGRRYYTTASGARLPSITTVLSQTMTEDKKRILEAWKKKVGEEEAERIRKYSMQRGTELHTLIETYVKDVGFDEEYDKAPRVTQTLFDQIHPAISKINNIHAFEHSIFSDKLQIGGRCDCIAEYDGVLSIIDFKTSTKIKEAWMLEDYFLQATFYAVAFSEQFKTPVKQSVIIIATENDTQPSVFVNDPKVWLPTLVARQKEYFAKFPIAQSV